jgi:hypothetical protein
VDEDQKGTILGSRCVVEDLLVVGVGDLVVFERRGHVCGVEVEFVGVGVGMLELVFSSRGELCCYQSCSRLTSETRT